MSGYQSLQLSDLLTRLSARTDGVPFWTQQEGINAINEALLTWGMLTGRWKATVTIPTTPNQYELVLPGTMVYRMRVLWNGVPLSPSARVDLSDGHPAWRQQTIASGGSAPTKPSLWAPVSLELLYIWPMDIVATNTWTIEGVSATPVLVNLTDYVDLSEADVSCLLGFALHVLLFKRGGAWFAGSMPLFRAFVEAAAEENSLITTSQWYRKYLGLAHADLKPLGDVMSPVGGLLEDLGHAQNPLGARKGHP